MTASGIGSPHRLPFGRDARRWSTFPGERTVVVAARTVTSTVRVLETLPTLLRGDSRIAVVFAHDPTSAFSDGVLDLLYDSGCRVMPWSDVGAVEPDLILSASENVDVPEGRCPVLVLPHGIGFQKQVPDSRSPRTRLSGMVPDALLASGRAWLAISHPDQEEQLRAAHPATADRTVLVGDPCFDELARSLPRADAYRRALGAADGRRLVVLSSTWGPTSLLGRDPELPARLLAALPYDEYRVAAIVHPNVWSWHGSWQVRTAQAAALDAGLLLMPTVHAWRPALVAADVVIGDHGSVTLYGAALGKPVLLAAFGEDAVSGTAVARLGQAAPRLDPLVDLVGQIESAIREHGADRYEEIAKLAFSAPGQALSRLRTTVYRLLELPEPTTGPPPLPALPRPEPPAEPVTSWQVTASAHPEDGQWVITVRRHPASVADSGAGTDDRAVTGSGPGPEETGPGPEGTGPEGTGPEDTGPEGTGPEAMTSLSQDAAPSSPPHPSPALAADPHQSPRTFHHLACDEGERDQRLIESATVLTRRAPAPTPVEALRWARATLDRLPGSHLAATALDGAGCLVALRDGRAMEATTTGPALDPGLPAAVIHACLCAGLPLSATDGPANPAGAANPHGTADAHGTTNPHDTFVRIRIGGLREEEMAIRLRPSAPPTTSAHPYRPGHHP
ncbi:hypothetical protein [Streptomyces sp. NPDC003077]|uniref:hypothetical protein n=1 Tax=Streptomyces sp. NPDC003077 TaxID=3154443 RepID=UPI0033BC89F2